mmetsp:Transcript_3025/g.13633  ORF Transcript_3025/g.13633 Transcript_3025/m.13633 type:complete len:245 (+) Transcript_3025:1606-2340(+)
MPRLCLRQETHRERVQGRQGHLAQGWAAGSRGARGLLPRGIRRRLEAEPGGSAGKRRGFLPGVHQRARDGHRRRAPRRHGTRGRAGDGGRDVAAGGPRGPQTRLLPRGGRRVRAPARLVLLRAPDGPLPEASGSRADRPEQPRDPRAAPPVRRVRVPDRRQERGGPLRPPGGGADVPGAGGGEQGGGGSNAVSRRDSIVPARHAQARRRSPAGAQRAWVRGRAVGRRDAVAGDEPRDGVGALPR